MARVLHVGSRKGLLTFSPAAGPGGWALADTAFLGEPVSALLPDPRDGALYAALNLGHFGVKLHRSDDGGANWTELSPPAFPADPAAPEDAPSVELIWCLAAGGDDRPGVLWAGTIPGGLFRSADRGASWTLVDGLWNLPERARWMGGGYDSPGIHSVSVDPRDSRRLTVGVSTGGVWTSADDGKSWTVGAGMRNEYMPPGQEYDPVVQDAHCLARCAGAPDTIWCQHHNGIFRSTDNAATFSELTPAAPSLFGFAVAAHPDDPDTAWFAPAVKDEYRVPVDGRLAVTVTRDGGATMEVLGEGLPARDCFDLVYRHGLALDARDMRLAMGSTTGNLWIGEDGGNSWTALANHLPPVAQVAWGREA